MRKKSVVILLSIIFLIGIKVFIVNQETVDNKAALTLSEEEKIEDFNYLYDILKDNYPFFEVNKRKYNVDWLGNKEKYINMIKNTKNDQEYIVTLSNIIKELNDGHTHLIGSDFYYYCLPTGDLSNYSHNDPYTNVLTVPNVARVYNLKKKLEENEGNTYDSSYNRSNYYTDIISPNEVAYLKIDSFGKKIPKNFLYKTNKFLNKIKDYSALIIDIRGNGGGYSSHWQNNIVSPLINEPISYEVPIYYTGGIYSTKFLFPSSIELSTLLSTSEESKIFKEKKLDELRNNSLNYYSIDKTTITPYNKVDFKGKIFLLVDKGVYSASEEFAVFCKNTGWATIVGENTGGGYTPMSPILVDLPNSGYVVRFPIAFCLNKDDTVNEEVGTEPDIHVDATIGETYEKDKAIQKVLQLVKEADSKESASACFNKLNNYFNHCPVFFLNMNNLKSFISI